MVEARRHMAGVGRAAGVGGTARALGVSGAAGVTGPAGFQLIAGRSAPARSLPGLLPSLPDLGRALLGAIRAGWQRAVAVNRPLAVVGALMIASLAGSVLGLLVDPRLITGAPAWLKPAKFAISITIYAFTFLWLLSYVRGHPRLVSLVAAITAAGTAVEWVIIAGQAWRGTTSHFNQATPLDAALYHIMAAQIVLVWLAAMATAVLLVRQRLTDPAFAWSLRLAVVIACVGMGLAFLMTRPTALQRADWAAGQPEKIVGAHAVGVRDGGPGLPLVGWSTEGGDLRVGHFVGLHGMQVLPFAGWLLTRRRPAWLGRRERLVLVWIVAASYLGLTLLVTWQALRGQPLVAPDGLTLSVLGALIAAGGTAAGTVLVLARRRLAVQVRAERAAAA
jgi:hypothetical protein